MTISSPRAHRVLIDASSITRSVDGLSTYIVNLLRHFPEQMVAELDMTVLLNPGVERADLDSALSRGCYSVIRAAIPPIGPRRDLAMHRFLKDHRGQFGVTHITSMTYPLTMRGGICTIHDVTFRRWFNDKRGIPGSGRAAQFYLSAMIRNCLRNADRIIAVSQATKDEIASQFNVPARTLSKIEVIHEGWEHMLEHSPADCTDAVLDSDFLFFLGSWRVHKNLTNLLEGFRRALPHIPQSKRLVISGTSDRLTGTQRENVAAINRDGERVIFTGYLSDPCVALHYQNADAFIFPSMAEGFGLPVLEAFHHETPLLAADTTALPEIAGDAALYFDPFDPAQIADAIVRFYADPKLAERLVKRGSERLKQFSWVNAAEKTAALYRECLERA